MLSLVQQNERLIEENSALRSQLAELRGAGLADDLHRRFGWGRGQADILAVFVARAPKLVTHAAVHDLLWASDPDGGPINGRGCVQVLRVLKPGGHLIAFGGTRTYHRLVCAIEDAGFEVRDQLAWIYGSGFPKSHDVSKGIDKAAGAVREVISEGAPIKRMIPGADQHRDGWTKDNGCVFTPSVTAAQTDAAKQWEGWGTALKPALEPIVLARKPLIGTVAENVQAHGTGALNIDASRIGERKERVLNRNGSIGFGGSEAQGQVIDGGMGRWPANVIHDGSEESVAAFPTTEAGSMPSNRGRGGEITTVGMAGQQGLPGAKTDAGSAARYFYSAKADAADRLGSKHPTVKPVDLMAYLVRLVTPPGGVVLDPFAGSGTTGMACLREGFDCILVEREAEYVADIRRRLDHVSGADAPLFSGNAA